MVHSLSEQTKQVRTEIVGLKCLQRTLTLGEKRRIWVDQFDPSLAELSKELRLILRSDFERGVEDWLKNKNLDRMRNDFRLYEKLSTKTILAPVAVSGIEFGSEVAAHLEKIHNKTFDFVFIGYPKSPEKCAYRGEGHMKLNEVYIREDDLEFLRLSNNRPIFVLDDFIKKGTTLNAILEKLVDLGFGDLLHQERLHYGGLIPILGTIEVFYPNIMR